MKRTKYPTTRIICWVKANPKKGKVFKGWHELKRFLLRRKHKPDWVDSFCYHLRIAGGVETHDLKFKLKRQKT